MTSTTLIREHRVAAFLDWLAKVEHPHWEQPGFSDFTDLTEAEKRESGRRMRAHANARLDHAAKLERVAR